MKTDIKKQQRAVWLVGNTVYMIDQILLPYEFKIAEFKTYTDTCKAIKTMVTRGAGSIGAAAGFAMWQAVFEAPENNYIEFISKAKIEIEATRPTARDLFAATERVFENAKISKEKAKEEAQKIADETAFACMKIGEHGNNIIKSGYRILTHCNAGRLALVDYGSALSPIYEAHKKGKEVFVYVDETRPRSQGARLTAWELNEQNVPHAVIPDNAAAWYMSLGKINMVITGADRIAANGDTANKIGTLEKAIAAKEYGIPFYIAAPPSTFDKNTKTGSDIIIEERNQDEVLYMTGLDEKTGKHTKIRVVSPGSKALNPAFDVTPAKLITGYITKNGIFTAEKLKQAFKTEI